MDIMETIRARYSEVSSVQKRIADYCLEHPDKASFQTLREFAQTTHTTDATVLKFCRNMGYHGFLAFRRQLQEYVRMRLSPNEKVRMSLARSTDASGTCRKIIDGEKRGLDMTFQYLDMEIFMQIVYRMNHARRIFVAHDDHARVVTRERTKHLRQLQLVDGRAGRVGQPGHRLNDDEVLRIINARHALPEDHVQLCRERMLHRLR